MTLEENLVAELKGATAVNTIMQGRLSPDFVAEPGLDAATGKPKDPDSIYPCATYTREKTVEDVTLDGDTIVRPVTFTISVFALTYAVAKTLADAIRDHLIDIRGLFGTDGEVDQIGNPNYRDASFDEVVMVYRMDLAIEIWTAQP
jgi:hypothetical protein